ncbi:MAG: exodeoxyribonuclease VII large subunit [Gemmatimonadota bacterium]|nr:exodeoxyribonuclease VII large subunit [Gemmatimonadota bacterium]
MTQLARDILEGSFPRLWVRGEVLDFKAHRNGHWYFCLRDGSAQIRCVVWSRDQQRIPAPPDEGMQVTALGQLTVYAARGDMQFIVSELAAEGDGLRRKAFEQTRAKLERDGLLAPGRKRRLARLPARVAVVTSPTGAAFRDIVAVIRRRCPAVEIVLVPAAVQGESAPAELAAAIDRVSRWGKAQTLIVGRGGGAREDLWAFNDERVARALASCRIPTISAVGHEVDVSLCDLVADLRAATPSAAAEAAVPVLADELELLQTKAGTMRRALERRLRQGSERLQRAARVLRQSASRDGERRRAMLAAWSGRLSALSPLATLSRGYAVARDGDGRALTHVSLFAAGAPFSLLLRDGELDAITSVVRAGPLPDSSRS